MNTVEALISMIGEVVFGNKTEIPDTDFEKLFALAQNQDLAHLITKYFSLKSTPVPQYIAEKAAKANKIAVFRSVSQDAVRDKIRQVLNGADIDFVLMKGAVIRDLYPEPWERTSCDIDVLIKESALAEALKALTDSGFKKSPLGETKNDIPLVFGGVTVELHFSISEGEERLDSILNSVWDNVYPLEKSEYRENGLFFVFHHLVHMRRHIITGGCGIKPFIDLYLLKKSAFYGETAFSDMVSSVGLGKFYSSVTALCDVWFGGEPHNGITAAFEKYIISGGVYGTEENKDAVRSAKNGKAGHILRRAFQPVSVMRREYPVLAKKFALVLLPFLYIQRTFKKLFGKNSAAAKQNLRRAATQDTAQIRSVADLFEAIDLLFL